MNARLRALLAAVGIVVIGGVSYFVTTPRSGVTRAQLLDAGIANDCSPVEISAEVRQFCRADLPRYGTRKVLAYQCADGGRLIVRWPQDGGRDCFEVTGDVVINGAAVDDGSAPSTVADNDRCGCRASDAGPCRYLALDGSTPLMNFRQSYNAPFVGASCIRKPCFEIDGEQGLSMPVECQ